MDLLTMVQTIWRHKLATIPVILFVLIGVVYVVGVKAPTYKTTSDYILVNPPAPPTAQQIAKDPALGRINTNNPYANWGDLQYVSSLLTATVTSNPVLGQLEKQGVDPRFTVGPDVTYPLGTPIVQVTGIGSSATAATRSAQLVGQDLGTQLDRLQADQGTDPRYFIKVQDLSPPAAPKEQLSSKLRTLIAVLAVGIILLFVAVSTMTAIEERRVRRAQPVPTSRHEDEFGLAAPTAKNGNGNGNGSPGLGAEAHDAAGMQQRMFTTRRRSL